MDTHCKVLYRRPLLASHHHGAQTAALRSGDDSHAAKALHNGLKCSIVSFYGSKQPFRFFLFKLAIFLSVRALARTARSPPYPSIAHDAAARGLQDRSYTRHVCSNPTKEVDCCKRYSAASKYLREHSITGRASIHAHEEERADRRKAGKTAVRSTWLRPGVPLSPPRYAPSIAEHSSQLLSGPAVRQPWLVALKPANNIRWITRRKWEC
ncbi:hypothetical protein KC360_g225 [Hortaea werneckii]|nr:hypothetical protein KC344_g227 [Hortaea werneckii]KAI7180550.1 hypothetical protein KC360_g225 [Hortaea werneckii]